MKIQLQLNVTYEEMLVKTFNCKERRLRSKTIPMVNVLRGSLETQEITWESENVMRKLFSTCSDPKSWAIVFTKKGIYAV